MCSTNFFSSENDLLGLQEGHWNILRFLGSGTEGRRSSSSATPTIKYCNKTFFAKNWQINSPKKVIWKKITKNDTKRIMKLFTFFHCVVHKFYRLFFHQIGWPAEYVTKNSPKKSHWIWWFTQFFTKMFTKNITKFSDSPNLVTNFSLFTLVVLYGNMTM